MSEGAKLTAPQKQALGWLSKHAGDGLFDNNGVLLAGGESAPFMRSTWNNLHAFGYVEIYKPAGKGRGRVRIRHGQERGGMMG